MRLATDVALVEAVGAFVGERRVADLAVAAFDARAEVDAHGVVPADAQVGVAGLDLHRLRAAGREGQGSRRREAGADEGAAGARATEGVG